METATCQMFEFYSIFIYQIHKYVDFISRNKKVQQFAPIFGFSHWQNCTRRWNSTTQPGRVIESSLATSSQGYGKFLENETKWMGKNKKLSTPTRYLNAFYCNLINIERDSLFNCTQKKSSHTEGRTKTHNQLIIWWASKSVVCCLSSTSTEYRVSDSSHFIHSSYDDSPVFIFTACRLHPNVFVAFSQSRKSNNMKVLSFSFQFFFSLLAHLSPTTRGCWCSIQSCTLFDRRFGQTSDDTRSHAQKYQQCNCAVILEHRNDDDEFARSQHDVLHSATLRCSTNVITSHMKAGRTLWDTRNLVWVH